MKGASLPEGRLRRAVPADAGKLALLGGATFLHAFAVDHPGDAIVAHVAETHSADWYGAALASPGNALWIVETPLAAPIAYAMLAPTALGEAQDGDVELKRLYVLGPWQGGNWGERLLDAVEAAARARGARHLLLCVYGANVGAQRFYARHGFADTGHCVDFLVGETAFVDRVFAKAL